MKDATPSTDSPVAPIFVYGTLIAAPLLAWAIKGDSSKAGDVLSQRKPGTIIGFERRRVIIPLSSIAMTPALLMDTSSFLPPSQSGTNPGSEALADEDWVFEYFETERLDAWLKHFGGMVLAG
ncbi:hypothetical protein EDB19DRAFT_1913697 [Suillus lakei]|nr:hypothetical protein EDB19DRAFT_1913697 [Suillus lakei]